MVHMQPSLMASGLGSDTAKDLARASSQLVSTGIPLDASSLLTYMSTGQEFPRSSHPRTNDFVTSSHRRRQRRRRRRRRCRRCARWIQWRRRRRARRGEWWRRRRWCRRSERWQRRSRWCASFGGFDCWCGGCGLDRWPGDGASGCSCCIYDAISSCNRTQEQLH
jgi:hypothetical protein